MQIRRLLGQKADSACHTSRLPAYTDYAVPEPAGNFASGRAEETFFFTKHFALCAKCFVKKIERVPCCRRRNSCYLVKRPIGNPHRARRVAYGNTERIRMSRSNRIRERTCRGSRGTGLTSGLHIKKKLGSMHILRSREVWHPI
jgi:hypothetical protein